MGPALRIMAGSCASGSRRSRCAGSTHCTRTRALPRPTHSPHSFNSPAVPATIPAIPPPVRPCAAAETERACTSACGERERAEAGARARRPCCEQPAPRCSCHPAPTAPTARPDQTSQSALDKVKAHATALAALKRASPAPPLALLALSASDSSAAPLRPHWRQPRHPARSPRSLSPTVTGSRV